MLHEYVGNLHVHSVYSDGSGTHEEVVRAAIAAGLDFVVVTDHNVLVQGLDGYHYVGDDHVLLLTGEEIHDPLREPQKDHLLVYEARQELAAQAREPQRLLNAVQAAGGLAVLAHPVDTPSPLFNELDLSWVSWEVEGFAGLEIWNFMSEFKSRLTSWPSAIYYAYNPSRIASGPFPGALAQWDRLLAAGRRVTGVGGSDAHAFTFRKGPLRRIIFPYEFLFRTVNMHILTGEPLHGDAERDRNLIFTCLRNGHCFVGYDLEASTSGFRFYAHADQGLVQMGEVVSSRFGITCGFQQWPKVNWRRRFSLLRTAQGMA